MAIDLPGLPALPLFTNRCIVSAIPREGFVEITTLKDTRFGALDVYVFTTLAEARAVETGGTMLKKDMVLAHVPDFETRVQTTAKALALASDRATAIDTAARASFAPLIEWLHSDDFRTLVAAKAEEARPRLKPVLTMADLLP